MRTFSKSVFKAALEKDGDMQIVSKAQGPTICSHHSS